MRSFLSVTAARQGGVFTRAQAALAGHRGPEIRGLTAPGGAWVVVRRGVYVERDRWEPATQLQRWMLRDRAAHVAMHIPHELSHDSAARLHGLPLMLVKQDLTHVTRADLRGTRTEHGIKHHLGPAPSPTGTSIAGLPVTGVARTAVDVAREHGLATGLAACDAALRLGVQRADLEEVVAGMKYWRGVSVATQAVELADPRAENGAESLARLLVLELGLGDPQPQFALRLDGRTVWCDLRVGCHVVEFDGRIKYRDREDGGLALKSAEEVVWDERQREREICAEGLGVSRLVWTDLFGAARERAKARLTAEYAVTVRRFGTRLPDHLASYNSRHTFDRVPPAAVA